MRRVLSVAVLCGVLSTSATAYAQTSRVTAARPAATTARVTLRVDNALLATVLRIIAQQAGLTPAYADVMLPAQVRVTLQLHDVPVTEAFQSALRGTGLVARVRETGNVTIAREQSPMLAGTIVGTVTEVGTKRPLRGVTILLDDATRGVTTNDDGKFTLVDVPLGEHRVTGRLIGYLHQAKMVVVPEGQSVTVDFALEARATALEQVVVTGTIIPTELKAVPNAITVITAKDIEQRGVTHIDQLFRGDVPGLFAQNQGSGFPTTFLDEVNMFSRGATALSSYSIGTSQTTGFFTSPIKTYVDGVELADPKYLSQIDPKSIERIEILTGPQASTIYGSNAINGVMQIFTKRGTSNTPQFTLNLLSGWVENNFSSARTPQHDYSADLNGIEGRLSYNAGASWNYIGPWTPTKQTARLGGFGGIRLELPAASGRMTVDMTIRHGITQSRQRGGGQQVTTYYREIGWFTPTTANGVVGPTNYMLTGQTLGLRMGYVPVSWWSHEFGLAQDASDTEQRYTVRGFSSISDTTLSLSQTHAGRRSLHYTTTIHAPITTALQATLAMGTDGWQSLTSSMRVDAPVLTGSLTNVSNVTRQPGHNTGSFLQTQIGVIDRLFLTYGLRAEWNPDFGDAAQPNYAPRYGVAYTQEIGVLTAKLRASYGRSTKPPQAGDHAEQKADKFVGPGTLQDFGDFVYYFANPELTPEHQQGGEGGLELYLGTHGSLVITRYNQTVDRLIGSVAVDSIDLPPAAMAQYGVGAWTPGWYKYQYQFVNIGSIRNQGWELQSSMNIGPITTKGTYSWTKSRTIGVNPKYRAQFANQRQYQPGATFQYLPEHTWALGVMYANAQTTVGVNLTGTGQIANFTDDFAFKYLSGSVRLLQNRPKTTQSGYLSFNSPYTMVDLSATRRISAHAEALLQVQNLADHYTNDYFSAYATIGRQAKLGFRIR